jgi:hypothetical protein
VGGSNGGGEKKLNSEEVQNFNSQPNIIKVIKFRRRDGRGV